MAGEKKACRILTCREEGSAGEGLGSDAAFCKRHWLLWALDGKEAERARKLAATTRDPVKARAIWNRALMDFINRIDAEDRNGTTDGK